MVISGAMLLDTGILHSIVATALASTTMTKGLILHHQLVITTTVNLAIQPTVPEQPCTLPQ